jgi:hypothetical protein
MSRAARRLQRRGQPIVGEHLDAVEALVIATLDRR